MVFLTLGISPEAVALEVPLAYFLSVLAILSFVLPLPDVENLLHKDPDLIFLSISPPFNLHTMCFSAFAVHPHPWYIVTEIQIVSYIK